MMSIETEARVARLIMEIAAHERQIEEFRQALARLPAFEPYAAFQRLDRKYTGYVTAKDLKLFLMYHCTHTSIGKTA